MAWGVSRRYGLPLSFEAAGARGDTRHCASDSLQEADRLTGLVRCVRGV